MTKLEQWAKTIATTLVEHPSRAGELLSALVRQGVVTEGSSVYSDHITALMALTRLGLLDHPPGVRAYRNVEVVPNG